MNLRRGFFQIGVSLLLVTIAGAAEPAETGRAVLIYGPLLGAEDRGQYRQAARTIGEARPAQPQPGGDALEEHAALLHFHAAGGGHDQGKLIV